MLKVRKEAVAAAAWFTLSCGGERSEAAAVAGIGPTRRRRRRRKEALEVGGSAIDGLEAMNHECTTKVHAETGERSWMLKLETRNVDDGKNGIDTSNVCEGLARQRMGLLVWCHCI